MELMKLSEGRFSAEASELGFAPGVWPVEFERDGRVWTRGAAVRDRREGGISSVEYVAADGSFLIVFND